LRQGVQVTLQKKMAETKTSQIKAPEVVGTIYTTVLLDKGKSSLTRESKEQIKAIAYKAHDARKPIGKIRILALSDNEYPDKITGTQSKMTSNSLQSVLRKSKIIWRKI
jgi:hypothetical protein